jgi:hypothetical protein
MESIGGLMTANRVVGVMANEHLDRDEAATT